MRLMLRCRTLLPPVYLVWGLIAPVAVYAGGIIKIDDTKSISIGAGLRTSFNSVENGAPNGTDSSNTFQLDSIRLYLGGQVTKDIHLTFNTERQSDGTTRVLDGIAQFAFSDIFNVWAGRFYLPSDRSNLSGPYYLATWDFPFVSRYPAIFAGRDDGLAVWGQTGGGKFKYQVGAFQGRNGALTSNQSGNLLYVGRLTFDLWDPEPGYYNASTYYGAKDILAFGLTAMSQADGVGTPATPGNYNGSSIDTLMEKKLGSDALSLEGAYYNYDTGGVMDPAPPIGQGLIDGHGYFVQVGYLFGQKYGPGQLQPHVRYQNLVVTGDSVNRKRYDLGLNYILDGHNALVSLIYARDNNGTTKNSNIIQVGMQLQI
ncbi:MAG: hypothetical protein ACYDBW_00705 [Sulfuricaulis sp.]